MACLLFPILRNYHLCDEKTFRMFFEERREWATGM